MNNIPDRIDGSVPSWPSSPGMPKPPAAVDYGDEFAEGVALPPSERLSAQLVWRALRRHWWQALVAWGVGSVLLMTLAYYFVHPTYDAIARVRVEPGEQSLYVNKNVPLGDTTEFKETQVASVTSPVVLGLALSDHPELYQFPRLRGAEDAEAELRQILKVLIVPKTNLIEIGMSSQSPTEAAGIVNAVLEAYLKNASSTCNEEIERRIEQLKKARDERIRELEIQRAEWRRLSDRVGAADVEGVKNRNMITTEDYRQWSDQLAQVEISRYATQAKLEQIHNEKTLPAADQDPSQIASAVQDAFYSDSRVASLQVQLDRAQTQLDHVRGLSRNPRDPAILRLQNTTRRLKTQIAGLWKTMRPRLENVLASGPNDQNYDRAILETEVQLAALKTQEDRLREKLNQMKIRSRDAGGEALQLEFARHDEERAAAVLHKVEDTLNQLEHEARSPIARVRKEFAAKPPNRPNANYRTKVMAAVPFLMLFLVSGLFVAVERRAGRVADPDELSCRARLQVLGVVPPLPALRSSTGLLARRDDSRSQRQLDEFVQSLDHLRVVLCARPDPWGRDRHCVLITSACGSEGKTTLAAQLAERCVNAGLMTLLVDADLRNPTLSQMLDATDTTGLINVLRDETAPEDAILVIGDAGGFHFLPAGTPRTDPSRILQGDALGKLLSRARESFDMIIVDAPPVLPVPDALTIGRWTDGAVLAVRYDSSRFALVERAQRRLAHVGVPVIGAVVNGMRPSGSSYGASYAYGSTIAPESPLEG